MLHPSMQSSQAEYVDGDGRLEWSMVEFRVRKGEESGLERERERGRKGGE